MKRLLILSNDDDWEAMYLDDKCIGQEHKISAQSIISAMQIHKVLAENVEFKTANENDIANCMDYGNFFETISALHGDY